MNIAGVEKKARLLLALMKQLHTVDHYFWVPEMSTDLWDPIAKRAWDNRIGYKPCLWLRSKVQLNYSE